MEIDSSTPSPDRAAGSRSLWPWLVGFGALAVVLLGLLLPQAERRAAGGSGQPAAPPAAGGMTSPARDPHVRAPGRMVSYTPGASAEETVAGKVAQFTRGRRTITHAMAEKFKTQVPPEADSFFAAVEAGRWEDAKKGFEELKNGRATNSALNELWGPILETFGVAEVAHNWPAQKLLDYGEAVLGSLRPGMVYAGGTDAGRFIPTLLNETGADTGHILVTQNALADNSYVKYLDFLYHDRLATLSEADSQRAFSEYIADARQRLAHDQQNPDEPKQVRPGEDIRSQDGRVTVAGHVAVMAVNERLLQMLMDKNPAAPFALEESFPLKSINATAVPLGPILEVRVASAHDAYTPDSAAQTLDYWRSTAQQVLADPGLAADSDVRKAYAKMAGAQASLLADHNLNDQASQAYEVAIQLSPSNPEVVFRYINQLVSTHRTDDAVQAAQAAVNAAPDNQQFRTLLDSLKRQQARR